MEFCSAVLLLVPFFHARAIGLSVSAVENVLVNILKTENDIFIGFYSLRKPCGVVSLKLRKSSEFMRLRLLF